METKIEYQWDILKLKRQLKKETDPEKIKVITRQIYFKQARLNWL